MFSQPLPWVKPEATAPRERLSTGAPGLDALLGGGIALGQLVEISGGPSSGKATLAFGLCVQALAAGQAAAWIAPEPGFSPLAALEAGACLDRLLALRVPDGEGALKAAQLLLSCPGAVRAAVVELPFGQKVGDGRLVQLQRLAERSGTVLVLLTQSGPHRPSLGVAVSLRLAVRRRPLGGLGGTLEIEILRHKAGPIRQAAEEVPRGPERLRVRGSL